MWSLLGLRNEFSLQKTSKPEIEKKHSKNLFYKNESNESSISRMVPKKPKVALYSRNTLVRAKNQKGALWLKKNAEKLYSVQKIFKFFGQWSSLYICKLSAKILV